MNTKLLILFVVLALLIVACEPSASNEAVREEKSQQGEAVLALTRNQPIPDLGGWSQEREIVRQTYLARNTNTSTYAYTMTYDGRIIEICASIGYPIPYSTQLTNPLQVLRGYDSGVVVDNPEPNGLYPPAAADATIVSCVEPDGSVTPTYWEQLVFALPYRVKSDMQIERIGESSFTVDLKP